MYIEKSFVDICIQGSVNQAVHKILSLAVA